MLHRDEHARIWGRGRALRRLKGHHRPSSLSLGITLLVGGALMLGMLSAPEGPSVSLNPDGLHANVQLTSGGVSGTIAPYGAGELWGGGSEVESCAACSPSGLLKESGGQSTQPGQDVNPEVGDFTTGQSLFDVPAVGGDLAMSMTYDSGYATAERDLGAPAGYFGYGWSSTMSSSASVGSGGTILINDENTAQYAFTPAAKDGCPVGDYEDIQKYTVVGSEYAYCAPNRTDAQLGYFAYGGFYQLNKYGGSDIQVYNAYGQLAEQSNLTNVNLSDGGYIQYSYNVTPGSTISGSSATCPSLSGETIKCWAATDTSSPTKRAVVSAVNSYGLVFNITDPLGRSYTMNYTDGDSNLNQVTAPSPTGSGTATTDYGYTTGASSIYRSDLNTTQDPNLAGNPTLNSKHITYYSYGMVQKVQDTYGNATKYTYNEIDCANNPSETDCTGTNSTAETGVTYPDGEYDSDIYTDGLLTAPSFGTYGGASNSWSFSYTEPPANDQDKATAEVVDMPSGSTATIDTDSSGNVVSYTDPNTNITTSMYNDTGGNNLDELCWNAAPGVTIASNVSCTNPPTGATTYTYDAYGDETSETDPLGNTTRHGYYENGLLCWTAPPAITAAGTPCATNGTSLPSGAAPSGATTYVYDDQGDLVDRTQPAAPDPSETTTSEYDLDGEVEYSIPPDGQGGSGFGSNAYETYTTYEPNGAVASVEAPAFSGFMTTSYTYDANGNELTESNPAGVTTSTYDYDNRVCWNERNLSGLSSPSCGSPPSTGATIYSGYVADTDAPTAVTDPDGSGFQTTYSYGDNRYPTSPTLVTEATVAGNPQSNIVTYSSYDDYGHTCLSGSQNTGSVGSCVYVAGDTGDTYDAEGQLQSSENPDAETTAYVYGNDAFPTSATQVTNSLSEPYQYSYNADGELYQREDPEGNWVSAGYNADGQLCYQAPAQTTVACGGTMPAVAGVSEYTYDEAGLRSVMTDNVGQSNQVADGYSYDANGNLISAQNDNDQTNQYAYDDADQVTCVSYPVSSAQSCSSTPSSTNTVVDVGYNAAGQLSSTTDWSSNTVSFSNYNALSEPQSIAYPSSTGESIAYTYDNDGNYTGSTYTGTLITGANSSAPNNDNQVESTSASISGSATYSASSPSDTYDAYGRVASATNPGNSSCGLSSCADAYVNSPGGEMKQDTPPGGSAIAYSYNAGAQLTEVDNPNDSADPYSSFQYNADGQRCWSLESTSATHTNTCAAGAPSGATSYGWNSYGQMCWAGATTSTSSTCTSPPTGVTTYSYDGDGLLSSEVKGSASRTYDWDTVSSTPQLLSNGPLSFIYGPEMFGVSAPIEEITASGTVQYLSSTPSGVQAAFTGGTSPALLELASYSIYGLQTLKSGTGVSPFKFEGSYNDSAIGSNLDYLINRYYDPSTDQFLSVDPDVAETDQPYAFTGDDPLNATDPTGNIVQNCGDECPPGVPTTGPTPPPGSVPVIPIAPPGSGATQLNDTTVAIAHQPSGDDSTENVAAQDYGEFAPADNPGYQRAMYQVNGMLNGYFNFPQNSTGGGWVILVDAGVIFVCAAGGEGVCIAAGVADAAAHGYSDVEHHCSASDTTIDVGLSLLSVGYGKLAELGKPALEGANGSIKLMYGATTTAPSAAGVVADPCE